MRRAGYALLLLFAAAWCLPAYANVPCYGGTVVYAPTVEDCPKRISDVSITPTVGGFDLHYESEGGVTLEIAVEAGHDQKCPGCPYATGTSDLAERRINWARLDDQAIKNATGMAVNSQQDASTAGEYTISVTGMGDGADYSIHLLPIETDGDYGQAWQRNVTTLTAAGDTLLTGAQRYNKATGNDLADGLTHATAWQTGTNCEAGMPTSADCRFLAGDAFEQERFVIANNGTIDDFTVFGCYAWNGADEVECDYTTDTRPTFGRDLTPTCITNANCGGAVDDYFAGHSVTSGFLATIEIEADYVKVAGLDVSYGAAIGIQAKGDGIGFPGSREYIIVEDNFVSYAGKQSISFLNGVQNFVIRRNELTQHSQCYIEAVRDGVTDFATRATLCDGGAWGGSLIASRNAPAYGLIENNDVHDAMGEGIGVGQGATRTIVRGNRGGNTHSTTFYTDMAQENVIESNIVWGSDTGGAGDYSGGSFGVPFGGGYAANVEKDTYSHNRLTIWRNNISVDGPACFRANVFNDAGAYAAGLDITAYAYGNTCVSSEEYGWRLTRRVTVIEAKSNIVWIDSDLGAAAAVSFQSVDPGYSFDFDYSLWRTSPSNSAGVGANDVVGGLVLATADASWETVDYATNKPVFADFELQAGSAGIGAGDPGLETEALPGGLTSASFGSFIWDYTEYPFPLDTTQKRTNWSKKLYYDALGRVRDPSTPDMGALEYQP